MLYDKVFDVLGVIKCMEVIDFVEDLVLMIKNEELWLMNGKDVEGNLVFYMKDMEGNCILIVCVLEIGVGSVNKIGIYD